MLMEYKYEDLPKRVLIINFIKKKEGCLKLKR